MVNLMQKLNLINRASTTLLIVSDLLVYYTVWFDVCIIITCTVLINSHYVACNVSSLGE